ncbi:adenylosuccinate synthase [Schaalia hyovaginalis]|uniref:Adenylosuccinate synthetase n=1 Tax=Schaalia hyovaginalis TaxID=29316 RepID=A0A923E5G5_9ACTO|nr:adenylosuccinate synthase [Schaalia hyovaginalis]MBB6333914.1 adenylosuccinate synthase [Schaalia hyovaginalis]MCI7672398.1 adenylosuccinate synthase [Schaalia hyovaginalis]MDY2667875.1 adenylosuccinate synthase [Schaalia hyovaginalis]MDY4492088.1 adenylosuccinate synthase [Schaalia hyovaginalis]MDY5506148.1 adenylosuccinate synthase [Schaalia hyovaginalis]
MPAVIVLGAQWGDEGKGKATDQLGQNTDYVVKFNGGNNAGHTVVIDDEKYALHLLPAGILSEGVTPIIGNGVVVDLEVLFAELNEMTSRGVDCSRLLISSNAHIIPPYNRLMDQANERARGKNQIGTTGRGIGPTYADKMNRIGLRIQDLFDPEGLSLKVEAALAPKNEIFAAVGMETLDPTVVTEELLSYAERVRPMVCDVSLVVNDALDRGDTVLFEGGQATMLDIDHGTYPFVTSSNPTAGGALTGTGVGPTRIDRVVGVAKAYTTRVGEGPFPTELDDEVGEALRQKGGEFGVTTGRPRRTGWFDAVVMRYATRINGLTDICLTKLDVLTGYETIPVCTAYEVDGVRTEEMPLDQGGFERAVPVYEELPGWTEDISECRSFDELPAAAQAYIARLEELSRCRIQSIGVGAGREATIVRYPLI